LNFDVKCFAKSYSSYIFVSHQCVPFSLTHAYLQVKIHKTYISFCQPLYMLPGD
jgi:hypothetical protein